jgi:hypothetical protein
MCYVDEGAPEESFEGIEAVGPGVNQDIKIEADVNQDIKIEAYDPGEDSEVIPAKGEPVAVFELDAPASIIPTTDTDLSIFVENLTEKQLEVIQAEINTLPEVTDKKTYDLTFSMHQVVKKIRQLTKKSVTTKIKTWKAEFAKKKEDLEKDQAKFMEVLEPMEKQLSDAREWWDMLVEAYKMNIAFDQAKADQLEQERQQLIRDEFEAHDMNALHDQKVEQDKKDAELKAEQDRLDRLAYELECKLERSGWTKEQAEIDSYRVPLNEAETEAWDIHKFLGKDGKYSDNVLIGSPCIVPEYDDNQECERLVTSSLDIGLDNPTFNTSGPVYDDPIYNDHGAPEETVEIYTADDIATHDTAAPDTSVDPGANEQGSSAGVDENSGVVDVTVCMNPEQDYIDSGHDDDTLAGINIVFEDHFLSVVKKMSFTDPRKQQKLENFIKSIEVNFNTFKKAVGDGKREA